MALFVCLYILVIPRIQTMLQSITSHLNDNRRGERLRDGAHIAIIGPPNAGKSSLLNLLGTSYYINQSSSSWLTICSFCINVTDIIAQREAAIVSEIPGTTRDVVEVTLNIAGYPVLLGDTAGIRMTTDTIEQEGINRAKKR